MSADPAPGRTSKKQLWRFPWGYNESFLVAFEILLLGLILEALTRGQGMAKLAFPVNIISGLALIAVIAFTNIQFKRQALVRWLSSVPAAVSSISLFAVLVLIQGFIPQNNPGMPEILTFLGLDHVKNSWIFTISGVYLLTTLGSVIMRKLIPLKKDNLAFLLNHMGLWITVAAGSLGAGDLQKLNIYLQEEGSFTSFAYDRENHAYTLPFSIKLTSFDINSFPPNLALIDVVTGTIIETDKQPLIEAREGRQFVFRDWQISINNFLQGAFYLEGNYFMADSSGAAPAAWISAVNRNTGQSTEGWISCGSYLVPHSFLALSKDYLIVMTFPEVQKYSSEVIIRRSGGNYDTSLIEVNRPCKVNGWRLYQLSYDEEKGKWSELSIIEAVNDPWLPLVYLGIFLLMGGAVYLFWIGRRSNTK